MNTFLGMSKLEWILGICISFIIFNITIKPIVDAQQRKALSIPEQEAPHIVPYVVATTNNNYQVNIPDNFKVSFGGPLSLNEYDGGRI